MKFKSDSQRKAIFANLSRDNVFSQSGKKTISMEDRIKVLDKWQSEHDKNMEDAKERIDEKLKEKEENQFAKVNREDYRKMTDYMDLSFDEKLNYETYDNRRYVATQMMNVLSGQLYNIDNITLMNLVMDYSLKHGASNVMYVDWRDVDRDYLALGPEGTKHNLMIGVYDMPIKKLDDSAENELSIDPQRIALRRFGKDYIEAERIGGGRDRDVYLFGDEKVLKVAKKPEGLMQNECEGDYGLEVVPELYEKGEDYVVVEKALRDDPRSRILLKPLQSYHQGQIRMHPHDLQQDLTKIDEEYGTDMLNILSYDVAWGDFTAPRNWGWKEDMPKLVDPGTLSINAITKLERNDPTVGDWRQILWERR